MGITEMDVALGFSVIAEGGLHRGYAFKVGRWETAGSNRNGCCNCIFGDGCGCRGSISEEYGIKIGRWECNRMGVADVFSVMGVLCSVSISGGYAIKLGRWETGGHNRNGLHFW